MPKAEHVNTRQGHLFFVGLEASSLSLDTINGSFFFLPQWEGWQMATEGSAVSSDAELGKSLASPLGQRLVSQKRKPRLKQVT